MMTAKDCFISHSSQDRAAALAIRNQLEQDGLSCWMAPEDVRAGYNWNEEIVDGIASSRSMILVVSKRSNESPHVMREVLALEGKPLFVVRIEDVEPSKGLRFFVQGIQWLDAFGDAFERRIADLCDDVRQRLDKAREPEPGSEQRLVGGRWELIRELGRGAMGVVYSARHVQTKRSAAVKLLLSHALSQPRFEVEARAAAEIAHEGIVDIFDAGSDKKHGSYLAMELLEGEDLRSRMRRADARPTQLLSLLRQALDPLAAAHAKGVVHRDLKPENLFVCHTKNGQDRVKILDFGIAKAHEDSDLTATGMAMGTPLYMSPEQAQNAKGVTPAADVWALGVMLYEVLTRRFPFKADNVYKLLMLANQSPHTPVRNLAPEVSVALAQVVDRCLAKAPEDRFANASELAKALDAALPKPERARPAPGRSHGIFLSCAAADMAWVEQHVYLPLLAATSADGAAPTVFFQGKSDAPAGSQESASTRGVEALFEALLNSERIVTVFTPAYFESSWARFVIIKALELDPDGRQGRLVPLLRDADCISRIPREVSHLSYQSVHNDGWFDTFLDRLGLQRRPAEEDAATQASVAFTAPIPDVLVNASLPPLELRVAGGDDRARTAQLVATGSALHGTLAVPVVSGVARFSELTFSQAASQVRLTANVDGAASVQSNAFEVKALPAREAAAAAWRQDQGAVYLLPDNLVSVGERVVRLYRLSDSALQEEVPLGFRVRVVRRSASTLLLGGWSGEVLVACAGGLLLLPSPRSSAPFEIVGDLDATNGAACVGYFDGRVVELGEKVAKSAFSCAHGVTALACTTDFVCSGDLNGTVRVHRAGVEVSSVALDSEILMLAAAGDVILGAARNCLFRVKADGSLVRDDTAANSVAAALPGPVPVVIDRNGVGLRVDRDLRVLARFETQPGTVPMAIDDRGEFATVLQPDGQRALVQGERVVYRQPTGGLGVAADGARFALVANSGLQVLRREELSGVLPRS
jgi:tRNA A-37 threonylcarbamoyl transferase component Bud32